MELRQLRAVLAVAETRSFTRAAERCFVVQSALSHQIKSLEDELGFALFARTSRRVELTDAGTAFLPAARASVDAAERAVADAAEAVGQVRGTLRIGLIPTVTAIDIPGTLRAMRQAYPAVRVTVHTAGSEVLMAGIRDGEVDVAVLGLPESVHPDRVASRVLTRERLVAVLSDDHRLAKRKRLRLADLAHETFIDFPAGTPGRAQSDGAFEAAGVQRDVAFEAMATGFMFDIVKQGLAMALLPAAFVQPEHGVTTVAVADGPIRVEHLAWRRLHPGPATIAFLELLR